MPMGNKLKRFYDKVDTSGDCHEWTAGTDSNGYGQIWFNKRNRKANRVAAYLAGILPSLKSEMHVLHKCDNPKCVNPEHLFLGTHQDNNKDKEDKGRGNQAKGSASGPAKLAEAEIPAIRADSRTLHAIAKTYSVSPSTISQIKTRRTWAHVA